MKIHIIIYYFQGDDIENEVRGAYRSINEARKEMKRLVEYENLHNISDFDTPLQQSQDGSRYEGYIQHFGEIYYEVQSCELGAEAKVTSFK